MSLDETLIRTFGRIKFKVRIISKSARYGIKIYVLTDAATAFVVRIIIYTGKFTYHEADNEKERRLSKLLSSYADILQAAIEQSMLIGSTLRLNC